MLGFQHGCNFHPIQKNDVNGLYNCGHSKVPLEVDLDDLAYEEDADNSVSPSPRKHSMIGRSDPMMRPGAARN